jgi:hypothetical protein
MSDVVPIMPALHELPTAVQALRNPRERMFVWSYLFLGANGAAAARAAGYTDHANNAKCRAHHLLNRDDIQAALREICTKYLFSLAPKALIRLEALLDKPDHKQHVKAIEMTLNRAGFGERTQIEINARHTHVIDHTQAAVEDLRKLMELGVPRAELVKTFGYTGLARYEKLLAAADAKLIEGEVVKDG